MRAQAQTLVTGRQNRMSRIPPSVQTLAERSTPAEIRLDIQKLLQQDQMELAQALGDAGLALHPRSEDMVGICALLAMSRNDWTEALELLTTLQDIQGDLTPATTFWLLARCHRCIGDDAAAVDALESGLMRFPASTELQAELTLMLKSEV
jgi:Tfp pilus assembly protein PilF